MRVPPGSGAEAAGASPVPWQGAVGVGLLSPGWGDGFAGLSLGLCDASRPPKCSPLPSSRVPILAQLVCISLLAETWGAALACLGDTWLREGGFLASWAGRAPSILALTCSPRPWWADVDRGPACPGPAILPA